MSELFMNFSCRLIETVCAFARPVGSKIRKIIDDSSGNAAIEYALCAGGVGIMGAGGASFVGAEALQIFDLVGVHLCQAVNDVCVIWR
jgi:Flp pilus assembly pilin Flp